MKKRELIIPICWILLGGVITVWSSSFPFGTMKSPGPALLPFTLGLLIIFLGTIVLLQALSSFKKGTLKAPPPFIREKKGVIRVAFTLGGMFLAAVLLEKAGFILTIFCLILLLLRTADPGKWRNDLFYVFTFTLGSFFLFQVLLKVALPRGVLGF